MIDRLLTEIGVASQLNVSTREIRELVNRNEIPVVVLPTGTVRFDAADVRRWIEDKKKGTAK